MQNMHAYRIFYDKLSDKLNLRIANSNLKPIFLLSHSYQAMKNRYKIYPRFFNRDLSLIVTHQTRPL